MDQFSEMIKVHILWHQATKAGKREDGSTILELHIGDHCDEIDENFLIAATSSAKQMKLVVEQCPSISQELCALLSKYVSPKLVEIHVINSPLLQWQDHLKRMLEACSNTIEVINLKGNKWVDDWVVEQLSVKYKMS